jgi:hypothetical protein
MTVARCWWMRARSFQDVLMRINVTIRRSFHGGRTRPFCHRIDDFDVKQGNLRRSSA